MHSPEEAIKKLWTFSSNHARNAIERRHSASWTRLRSALSSQARKKTARINPGGSSRKIRDPLKWPCVATPHQTRPSPFRKDRAIRPTASPAPGVQQSTLAGRKFDAHTARSPPPLTCSKSSVFRPELIVSVIVNGLQLENPPAAFPVLCPFKRMSVPLSSVAH